MTRILALALLLTLPLAMNASANPCAAPCGRVAVVFDCVNFTATAEGESTLFGVEWTFVVTESFHSWRRVHTETMTGPVAAFEHSDIAVYLGYPYEVEATIYGNGDVVATRTVVCGL